MGVKNLIYISTTDVTFTETGIETKKNETHPFSSLGSTARYAEGSLEVGDHYARTKIIAEKYISEQNGVKGLRTISLRPNGVYGPGENTNILKAVQVPYLFTVMPFHFGHDQFMQWTCVGSLAYAAALAHTNLQKNADLVGGKAYFIVDDEITTVSNWTFFEPISNAVGGYFKPIFYLPLTAISYHMEKFASTIYPKTGINLAFLSYKEALKGCTTDLHDTSLAKRELGFKPIFSTDECTAHTGEEFARRWNS